MGLCTALWSAESATMFCIYETLSFALIEYGCDALIVEIELRQFQGSSMVTTTGLVCLIVDSIVQLFSL
jgi:hypothetical protein